MRTDAKWLEFLAMKYFLNATCCELTHESEIAEEV
jgi:hypothetical protein